MDFQTALNDFITDLKSLLNDPTDIIKIVNDNKTSPRNIPKQIKEKYTTNFKDLFTKHLRSFKDKINKDELNAKIKEAIANSPLAKRIPSVIRSSVIKSIAESFTTIIMTNINGSSFGKVSKTLERDYLYLLNLETH